MADNPSNVVSGNDGQFNRNSFGLAFQKNSAVYSLFFGTRSRLLEDEMNEIQWNHIERTASFMRSSYKNGILNDYSVHTTPHDNLFYISGEKPLSFLIDGYELKVGANAVSSQPQELSSEDTRLLIKLKPHSGVTRNDFVILEAWFESISYQENFRKFGGETTPIINNQMLDGRVGEETSRRIQFRWRVRTIENKSSITGVTAVSYDGKDTGVEYRLLEGGIYSADIGIRRDSDDNIKSPGIIYGVPLFVVSRKATSSKIDASDIGDIIPISTIHMMDAIARRLTVVEATIEGDLNVTGSIYGNIANTTYTHEQNSPSNTWIINHGMGKFPSVTIVDSSGTMVYGEVVYISEAQLSITFSAEFSGKAYLN